jgi:hypothetical protein
LVAKKKVTTAAASVLSTETFSTTGLALKLEVPTTTAGSIRVVGRWGRSAGTLTWMAG